MNENLDAIKNKKFLCIKNPKKGFLDNQKRDAITGKRGINLLNRQKINKHEMDEFFNELEW